MGHPEKEDKTKRDVHVWERDASFHLLRAFMQVRLWGVDCRVARESGQEEFKMQNPHMQHSPTSCVSFFFPMRNNMAINQ